MRLPRCVASPHPACCASDPPPQGEGKQTHLRDLATAFRPSLTICSLPRNREGAGKTGCLLHPRSHVPKSACFGAHEHTGSAETLRPSLRNGFTTYSALSLVNRASCHHRPREAPSL